MANISLKGLLSEAEDFKAKSKESGKMVHFQSKDSYQAALKAGTHEDPKAQKGGSSKGDSKPNSMFGGDYSKDRGGETPTSNTSHTPVKPDSKEVNIISGFTRMREKFVADFINKHKLDADALSKFVHKGSLRDRMDVGTAMAGNPGNEYEKDLIKKFGTKDTESKPAKSKYDDKSYWKDDEKSDTDGALDYDMSDYDDDDFFSDDAKLTLDRLNKVETALEDELNLRGNGFETTRESGGGSGGFEGPMTIVSKDVDYNDEDNFISLSVGSPNNDGKFSIVFANSNGEPYFEPEYDALTGDTDLTPQQAFKVTKALMQMPEVQKLLKGEMSKEEFQPIYDKLKAKFSKGKTESTKLTSMIKR